MTQQQEDDLIHVLRILDLSSAQRGHLQPAMRLMVELMQRQSRRTGPECNCARCVLPWAGNGSQWPQMGRELIASSAVFRASLAACAAVLTPLGIDLLGAFEAENGFDEPRAAAVGLASIQVSSAQAPPLQSDNCRIEGMSRLPGIKSGTYHSGEEPVFVNHLISRR